MQFSQRIYSQEMKLSFNLKNATLKDVINEIKRISVYDFVYSDPQLTSFKQRACIIYERDDSTSDGGLFERHETHVRD